jgi:transposase
MTGGRRDELERLARSRTASAREVRQAKALLWATDGVSNAEIARRCASTPKSVRRWRSRFAAEGTAAVGRIRAGVAALLCSATMLWKRYRVVRSWSCALPASFSP